MPTDDEEEGAALRPEDLGGEPYSPNGDEGGHCAGWGAGLAAGAGCRGWLQAV